MTRSKPVNRTAFCCFSLTAALILTACSSGGGGVAADIGAGLADALTAPLDHKDKSLQSLTLDQSVRKNEKLKLAAQGAEKTYGNGDSLNTGKLKNDKVSRFDFIRQIEVDGQLITLESGEFQVYKQSHSALTALQTEQVQDSEDSGKMVAKRQFRIGDIAGEHTSFDKLPKDISRDGVRFRRCWRKTDLYYRFRRQAGTRQNRTFEIARTQCRACHRLYQAG